MEILGIGPLEFFFILVIALIILGPSDMVKAGRTIGRFLRQLVTSPNWRVFTQASREIRNLPNKLMREAGLDNEMEEIKKLSRQADLQPEINRLDSEMRDWSHEISSWTTPPPAGAPPNPEQKSPPIPQPGSDSSPTIIPSPEPPASEPHIPETKAD